LIKNYPYQDLCPKSILEYPYPLLSEYKLKYGQKISDPFAPLAVQPLELPLPHSAPARMTAKYSK